MARNLKLYATPFKFLAVSILGLQNTQQSIHTIAFSEDPQWVAINSKGAFLSYCIINILKYVYTRSNIHSSYILRRGVTTKLSLVSSKPKKIESKFVLLCLMVSATRVVQTFLQENFQSLNLFQAKLHYYNLIEEEKYLLWGA